MRILINNPVPIFRLKISRVNNETKHLNLIDTTFDEVITMVQQIITPHIKSELSPLMTIVQIREVYRGENGRSKSVSFYGIGPTETYDLIVNHVNSLTNATGKTHRKKISHR